MGGGEGWGGVGMLLCGVYVWFACLAVLAWWGGLVGRGVGVRGGGGGWFAVIASSLPRVTGRFLNPTLRRYTPPPFLCPAPVDPQGKEFCVFCRRQHRMFIDKYFEEKVKTYKRWFEQRLNKENKDEEKRIEHVKRVNEVGAVCGWCGRLRV